MAFPMDKWVLMMIAADAEIRNLGDVKWISTEDKTAAKGMGRHIACFILDGRPGTPLICPSVLPK